MKDEGDEVDIWPDPLQRVQRVFFFLCLTLLFFLRSLPHPRPPSSVPRPLPKIYAYANQNLRSSPDAQTHPIGYIGDS